MAVSTARYSNMETTTPSDFDRFCTDSGATVEEVLQLSEEELEVAMEMLPYEKIADAIGTTIEQVFVQPKATIEIALETLPYTKLSKAEVVSEWRKRRQSSTKTTVLSEESKQEPTTIPETSWVPKQMNARTTWAEEKSENDQISSATEQKPPQNQEAASNDQEVSDDQEDTESQEDSEDEEASKDQDDAASEATQKRVSFSAESKDDRSSPESAVDNALSQAQLTVQALLQYPNHVEVHVRAFKLLAKVSEQSSDQVVSQQMISMIPMVVQGMEKFAKHPKIQLYGCLILANVAAGYPTNAKVLREDDSLLPIILRAMQMNVLNSITLQTKGLQLLWSILGTNNKITTNRYKLFLSKGGLDEILQAMRDHPNRVDLNLSAMFILNDFTSRSVDFQSVVCAKGGIEIVLRALQINTKNTKLQAKGMELLWSILSSTSSSNNNNSPNKKTMDTAATDRYEVFFSEGGLDVVLKAMTNLPGNVDVALNGMSVLEDFARRSLDFRRAVSAKGGMEVVLHAMRLNTSSAALQTKGLQLLWTILSFNSNSNSSNTSMDSEITDRYEYFFSEGGLDVVLKAMRDHIVQPISASGMLILKDFTRRSLDFQRAVSAKGGIEIVLDRTRRYPNNYPLQEAAMAFMRNICLHEDNRLLVNDGVLTIVVCMGRHVDDSAIQAYGCDALGRLAMEPKNQVTILEIGGIETAIRAMENHRDHVGVQDRACFLLDSMTDYPPAMKLMKRLSSRMRPLLANAKLPPKEQSKVRLESLKRRLRGQ